VAVEAAMLMNLGRSTRTHWKPACGSQGAAVAVGKIRG
jgi:hypothetical protein